MGRNQHGAKEKSRMNDVTRPCRMADHRALEAHSCGALSSRWRADGNTWGVQISTCFASTSCAMVPVHVHFYFAEFPTPMLVAAQAKNSNTHPSAKPSMYFVDSRHNAFVG